MHYLKPYILELVNFEICFIFLDLELFTKIKKRPGFYALTETRIIDNERAKHNEKVV